MHARRLALLLLVSSPAGVGCGGGGGAPVAPPAIVSVSPTEVWREDVATFAIVGAGTRWSPSSPPPIDAGLGVTVESVTVESATALRVTTRIAFDATVGARPLFVGTGAARLASGDVTVRAPITASWFSQPSVRASVLVGALAVRRPGDVIDGPVVAVASDASLLPLYLDGASGFIVVVPEDAPLGPFELRVHRTGVGAPSTARVPAGSIGPRAETDDEFPRQVSLPTVDGTALHRHVAASACLLEFPMTSSDPTLPIHFLYAHESPFAPPVVGLAPILYGGGAGTGPRALALAGETFDVIVFSGHTSYTIGVAEASTTPVAEVEPNDTAATAQALAWPALVAPATMTPATGSDWFAVTSEPSDVGKSVRVVTSPGPALAVVVVRADLATVLGAASASGPGAAIDLRTSPIPAAETLYVRVTAAAGGAPDLTDAYRLFVRLDGP